jgi:hypothetical protein
MLGVSTVYGDKFIDYHSPSRQPHSGVGNPRDIQNDWESYARGRKYLTFLSTPVVNPESYEVYRVGWPDKKDPFTQTDLLANEEEQVQELILEIRTSPSICHGEVLANRLVTLFYDAKEEDFTNRGIVVGSLRNFYNFFQLHTDLKCPTISLTPDNNIYASWRVDQKKVFSVLFLPNGDTRFVIFKPNDLHPERQIRISGTTTTDMLKAEVAPHGVWDWISE